MSLKRRRTNATSSPASLSGNGERYLAVHDKNTRYWRMARARLQSADVKAIQDRPIALITRAQIAAVIDKVQGRSNASARLYLGT